MKQLLNKTKSILILLLALSFLGCEEDEVVLPQVVAGFTHTIDVETRVVTFINTSTNATSYSWDFGDETTLDEVNPIKQYPIGSYTIVLTANNVSGASDTYTDTIIFLDVEIPLITLNGDANVNVTLGDTYTDAGATALDAVDGDLTANIVVGGDTVDTSVEGVYTITYDVSDSQGNEAIQVTRTVNVSAISCTAETMGSISASDLNLTLMSDPTASITNDGADFTWINNPDFDNTINPSCKVGQITKQGNNPWDNTQIDLDAKLDFNANTGLKIKVWSSLANTEVRLKLEEIGNVNNNVEQFLTTSVTNGWEELTFPYTAADSNKFDKIVIFFDLNANNTDTYYFDDLMLYGTGNGGGGGGGTNCTAETMQSLNAADVNITFMSDPAATGSGVTVIEDNATYEYVDNPDFSSGVNSSCKVGKVTKSAVQPWDNIQIDFADKLTFTDNSNFTIKVFSPVSGYNVTFKLEDKTNSAINTGDVVSTTSTTTNNQWEELTIPFSAADTNKYDKLVIFFDLAGPANTNSYYFDDLKLNEGSGGGGGGGGGGTTGGNCTTNVVPATSFPVDFEACESFTSFFSSNSDLGITPSLDSNPNPSGINTSSSVLKVVKGAGIKRWAGVQNVFASNFNAEGTFKIKVYTTEANVVMRFEINSNPQDNGSGNPGPQFRTIANANTWTEVEIVFTGIPPSNTGVNQFVIKPDNPDGSDGQDTTSEKTFYFDDLRIE